MRGPSQRRYEPDVNCRLCGTPAALGHDLCHDCERESRVNYIPDPATIARACRDIRMAQGDPVLERYTIPTVRVAFGFRSGD
jgi:hypothetical protein